MLWNYCYVTFSTLFKNLLSGQRSLRTLENNHFFFTFYTLRLPHVFQAPIDPSSLLEAYENRSARLNKNNGLFLCSGFL